MKQLVIEGTVQCCLCLHGKKSCNRTFAGGSPFGTEVYSVEGEKVGTQNYSLQGSHAVENHVGCTVLYPHILRLVGEIVYDTRCEVAVHPCALQLVPQKVGCIVLKAQENLKNRILTVFPAFTR